MADFRKINITKLIVSIIIPQLAGAIGSIFTFSSISTWYATLQKPFFTPPNWLFGPVWITLYILMGISLYLVWQKGFKKKQNKIALYFFSTQLALNALWSILFFGLKEVFYALIEIIVLWVTIALTIVVFYKISKKAAVLLIPYIVWVSIATVLNLYIWQLNFGF